MSALANRKWITPEAVAELSAAYRFLRTVEHRLQMVGDEQTQTLPEDPEKLASLAAFLGYDSVEVFSAALVKQLMTVQGHYGRLFEDMPELTSEAGGSLVFTGDADDPDTSKI